MEYILFILALLSIIVWGSIIYIIGEYAKDYFSFAWTLYKHPEDGVCCCGVHVDDHSAYENHAVKTQREWFIECNKPKFM